MRYSILILLLLCCFCSCGRKKEKELNRRITLWRKDKIPYGTELAYQGLDHLFPNSTISVNKKSPGSLLRSYGSKKAYIIIVPTLDPRPADVNAIMELVGEGDHVFISAHHVGDSLLNILGLKTGTGHRQLLEPDGLKLNVYDPIKEDFRQYTYPGDAYDNWFVSMDTLHTTVIGKDHVDRPDFVKFTYKSGGSLYLQLAPMAFSNFFLLNKENKGYYETALSNLPGTVGEVVWDDYFRYNHNGGGFSALQYIFSIPALKWAFWLLLLLFTLIYLFDSKRRQRMIPVVTPLRNTSLDFVRTIGRLYFQRRDNHNLAVKMVNHFLDQVRTRYRMSVSTFDEDFINRLSYRTGYPREAVSQLIGHMQALQGAPYLSDEELMDFHQQLEAFYKSV